MSPQFLPSCVIIVFDLQISEKIQSFLAIIYLSAVLPSVWLGCKQFGFIIPVILSFSTSFSTKTAAGYVQSFLIGDLSGYAIGQQSHN